MEKARLPCRRKDLIVTESRWLVPLSDVAIDDEILAAAADAVRSGWWSMGPRVAAFEQAFAATAGCEHAFAVANGTAALHLALVALDVGPGDEVVLPSLNFVAAANVVMHVGATPVFCDIKGIDDLNLDPADLEAAIGERTKAVIVLHYAGYACNIETVLAVAERAGVAVIEDAAHAPGATRGGIPLGSFGAIGCFSFFSNKNLPVGEGGMCVTRDDALAAKLRLLRSHGMTTLTWDRHRGHAHSYDVVAHGFNYRLDEIRAAIASVQLERLPAGNLARRRHADHYRELLADVEGLTVPFGDPESRASSSHHIVVVVLPQGASRPDIRAALEQARIQTSVHYPPIHRFSAFATAGARRALPQTDDVSERLLTLPLYPHMTDGQVEAVARALREAIASSR